MGWLFEVGDVLWARTAHSGKREVGPAGLALRWSISKWFYNNTGERYWKRWASPTQGRCGGRWLLVLQL